MNSPFKAQKDDSSGSSAPERQQLKGQGALDLEAGDTVTEQAQPSAASRAQLMKADQAAQKQKAEIDKFSQVTSLDWKQIPPPMLAQILVSIPFKGSGTDPDYYLSPVQGMIFALRCFELGLSPFSNEVWFNSKNNKVNVTLEGKLKLARKHGLDLGPPQFTRVTKKLPNGKEDYGIKCTMTTSRKGDLAEYTAWHSEWFVASSPVWKTKTDHMLSVRATEKCISFASGIGTSELMDEKDLQVGKEVAEFIPSFTKKQEQDNRNAEVNQVIFDPRQDKE